MPINTNILMIRHAERPDKGTGLSVAGQARAQAYIVYFQNYLIANKHLTINYLFASADSAESIRPRMTIEPLAAALKLKINGKHSYTDYNIVKDHIMNKPKYKNSNILICWHHEEILNFAKDLGADSKTLPPGSNWPPSPWPEDVYGWVMQVCFDSEGNLDKARTLCVSEQLMYNDGGKQPPLLIK